MWDFSLSEAIRAAIGLCGALAVLAALAAVLLTAGASWAGRSRWVRLSLALAVAAAMWASATALGVLGRVSSANGGELGWW